MSHLLVFFGTEPDVDHMVPLAWKCLEKGHAVTAVFHCPCGHRTDARVGLLRRYPRFRTLRLPGVVARPRPLALASQLLWPRPLVRPLLRRREVAACCFGWGKGLSRPGARLRGRALRALRSAFLGAALDLGLPAFALPNGVHLIPPLQRAGPAGPRPRARRDRDCFTAYVVATERHRQWAVEHHGQDPAVVQNWGSLRFSPEWRRVLLELAPEARLPGPAPGQVRLLCFLPKWMPFVDRAGTVSLVRELARRDDVQLVIKTHPHRGLTQIPDLGPDLPARPNVVLAGDASSLRLIAAADAAVVVQSSIVIETILQRKPLIHAAYLHPDRDADYPYHGSRAAAGAAEVHALVDRVREGDWRGVEDEAVARLSRELVYGDREPFDVPEHYHARIHAYLAPPAGRISRGPVEPSAARSPS